jgi:ribosomal protein S18 acetylase RimI-like enzyme
MARALFSGIRRRVVQRWSGALLRRDLSEPIPIIEPRMAVSVMCVNRVPTREEADRLLSVPGGQQFVQRLAGGHACILANVGDRTVGYGWLAFGKWRLDDLGIVVPIGEAECVLYDLYTEADARGSLIGSTVAVALMQEAKRRGYRGVYCRVSKHNRASKTLFSHLGFLKGADLSCLRLLGKFGGYVLRLDNPGGFGEHLFGAAEWLGPSIQVWKTGARMGIRVRAAGTIHRAVA